MAKSKTGDYERVRLLLEVAERAHHFPSLVNIHNAAIAELESVAETDFAPKKADA